MADDRAAEDALLATARAELRACEEDLGTPLQISVDTSRAAGNCRAGVLDWRSKNAGGRAVIPAGEILDIAEATRDRVTQAVAGVRRAVANARKGR